jgi:hypothetical protein
VQEAICFNENGTKLAYWCWDGRGTSQARIVVLGLPDGKVLTEKLVQGKIPAIRRSADAFEAMLSDGDWIRIESKGH